VLIGNGTSAVTSVAPGSSGNVLVSNGTTWTSALPPVSGVLDAVATGSLSNGSTVVINSDGTVSVVGPVITPVPSAGTSVTFSASSVTQYSATYDSVNQKIVLFYYFSAASTGYGIVGTVSGSTISFGSPAAFFGGPVGATACAYDTNAQKIVLAFVDNNSGVGAAVVVTVSGTSLSFGTIATFQASTIGATLQVVYHAAAQKVVIAYIDASANQGKAIVGTVSSTTISFGTAVQFTSSAAEISAAYDATNQKIVIAYRDTSGLGTAIVGTVSGTSISFGTAVTFSAASTFSTATAYDANAQKVVISYQNAGNSNFGTAIVGTVSGTSISFGTAVVFESASTNAISAVYDTNAQKIVFSYADVGNSSYGTAIVGTVSGTSISFSTPVVFESAAIQITASAYNVAAQKIVTAFRLNAGGSGKSSVISPVTSTPNLTSENFIGFSSAAYTNGQTATIQLVGAVDDAQSGLTPGQSYYVLTDGTLSLTAGSPSVFAGTAVAANKIIVKG
jgi:hypothetical protein